MLYYINENDTTYVYKYARKHKSVLTIRVIPLTVLGKHNPS